MSLFTQFSNALLGKPQTSNFSAVEVVPAQTTQLVQAQQALAKTQARQQLEVDMLTQFVGEHAADYVQHRETVNARLNAAEQAQQAYEQRIKLQQEQLDAHDALIAKLQQKHEGVAKQVTANHARLDEHDGNISSLRQLAAVQQQRIEELEAKQTKLETASHLHSKELLAMRKQQKSQQDLIDELLARATKKK